MCVSQNTTRQGESVSGCGCGCECVCVCVLGLTPFFRLPLKQPHIKITHTPDEPVCLLLAVST